jgi:hypothetical protein
MNLFSELPSIRSALLLLCAAFAYRTVAAGSQTRRLLWAAASGLLCFTSQLVTPEIAVMGAAVLLGTIFIHALMGKDRRFIYPAAAFIGVLIALNTGIAIFFTLSSTTYVGLFEYQRNVIETIRGYSNTMGMEWGLDQSTTNFLAVLFAYIILAAVFAAYKAPALDRCLIASFLLAGLVSLKSAFVRSDIGHVTFAVSPFVFAFLMLAKKEWQPPFGRGTWPLFAAGLLWAWPWVTQAAKKTRTGHRSSFRRSSCREAGRRLSSYRMQRRLRPEAGSISSHRMAIRWR